VPKTPAKSSTPPDVGAPADVDLVAPAHEHRALALAYRPQTFEDIAGQRHVTDVLAKAVEHGRIAHAYLLSGPRGTGKTTSARILAKVLNCPFRKGATPCNVCDSCRDITSGVSLDVVEIDGASNRGIADIQQLRESVRFAATGGRYKVYVIDEVHQLSGDAFAALLKTLEEPPPHVVFVFATTDPLKLPDTIRSRCQRYELARVPVRAIAERLATIAREETKAGRTLELTPGAALLIARKAEGGLRDAVSALDQVASTGRTTIDEAAVTDVLGLVSREAFFELADPIFARDPAGTLAAVTRAYAGGFDPKDLAEGLLEHFRNVLVLKVDTGASDLLAATPEECARYEAQSAAHSSGDLLRLVRITTDAIGLLREASQPLLHLEAALLEMAHLEPGRTLADILARLEEIEASGPASPGGGGLPTSAQAPGAARPAPPPAPPGRAAPVIPGLDALRRTPTAAPPPSTSPSPASGSPARLGRVPEDDGRPPQPAAFDSPSKWPAVLELLMTRKRMLGHFLEQATPLGWNDNVLVLEIDAAHRGLIEHKDNRAVLVTALREVYARDVDYRCVSRSGPRAAAPAVPPAAEEPPPPSDDAAPPPDEAAPPVASAPVAAAAAPANAPAPAADARRVHPADLSTEARNTMVWLEGEIVGPERPTSQP
jgi:DNA polymerase-3 subunit gamma/tau